MDFTPWESHLGPRRAYCVHKCKLNAEVLLYFAISAYNMAYNISRNRAFHAGFAHNAVMGTRVPRREVKRVGAGESPADPWEKRHHPGAVG